MDLEKDIVELRTAFAAAKAEESRLREAADQVVAGVKESGVNPLTDNEAFVRVDEAYKAADAARDTVAQLGLRMNRALAIVGERADERKPSVETREARTVAERLLRSDEYARLRDSGDLQHGGARVQMSPVEVATREEFLDGLRFRTTVDNSSGSGGGVIWSDRLQNLIVAVPQRRVRLLDVIAMGTTDTDTVEWVYESTHTDAAAETAYGTAAPEAAYGWTKTSTTAKRVPHFVPATKGAIADSGQLQTLLTGSLGGGLLRRIETQVYGGNGTGENIKGITAYSGISTQAKSTDTRWDAAHKAITKVRIALEDEPTTIVIHPSDWEDIVLEKDSAGNYTNGRGAQDITSIWGLTPVVSTLATAGTALIGDFSYATAWMRSGISIAMSDSHSDFFLKGLVAILAEARLAFAVTQEKAFCTLTGI